MSHNSITQDFWITLREELKTLFPKDIFDTWFSPLKQLDYDGEKLLLGAPNDFSVIWIEDNYIDLLGKKAHELVGSPVDVVVTANDSGDSSLFRGEQASGDVRIAGDRNEAEVFTNEREAKARKKQRRSSEKQESSKSRLSLNPSNTFENFVVGGSNQLAHAASMAVVKSPAKAYNPLFLYGDTGLGKTHLMHAMAHHILDEKPDSRVVYISCEKFTNEFIRAIQENTLVQFRKFYRNIDMLLIDDIHFLAGKERIQEEFFHTFNELFESQRQICFSSDRPASEIAKLESRLVSRFQWGMVTDIHAPDLETRVAILAKKAQSMGHSISNEILEFLAQRITRNVRRMEGALTRVTSFSTLTHQKLDISTVERLLKDILQEEAQKTITIEKIQKRIVDYYQLRLSDMVSKRRPSNIAFPRQVAMYLSRILTNHSLQEIGESFGGRDHGTVIHACKTVENMMEQDANVARSVEYLTKQLSN